MPNESSPPFFPKPFKVPLQAILIVPFVIQTVETVGMVGYLSFRNGQKAVNDVAAELRNETSSRIAQNLTHLVATPFQAFESYEAHANGPTTKFQSSRGKQPGEKCFRTSVAKLLGDGSPK